MPAKEIQPTDTDKRANIGEVNKQSTFEDHPNKHLVLGKIDPHNDKLENISIGNDSEKVKYSYSKNERASKETDIQICNNVQVPQCDVKGRIQENLVKSNKGIPASNCDEGKQCIADIAETHAPSPIQNPKNTNEEANSNDNHQHPTQNKAHELERRESRISEKSAVAVQAYQEALERILKAAKDKKKHTEYNEDDSSEIGLDLWKRAKASVLKKMKTPTEEDTIREAQDEEKSHKVKFHKWKRAAVPPARQSGYSNRRRSITEMQNTLRRKLALRRFRRFGNLVIFCRRCVQDHCFK